MLTGPNGAGKTNLLEAISYLAPGRGLLGARLHEVDRRGGNSTWAVAATVLTPEGTVDIGTGRGGEGSRDGAEDGAGAGGSAPASVSTPARRADRRVVRINGAPARGPSALSELVSVLWLTPPMDRLFTDGARARRRFLDRLVFGIDPAHAGRLAAFDRALGERARLLRNGVRDAAWLSALERTMAERGVAISAARREAAARVSRISAQGVGPFPAAALRVEGMVEDWLDQGPALAAEERWQDALAAARPRDAETGGAGVGPSDLAVHHAARDMPAKLCSTGEQKALLISIVLANARLQAELGGVAPLLLLDEVAAHLDESHRHALFEDIRALGAQAWLTGTDMALFADLGGQSQFFRVVDAAVTPVDAPA